MGASLASRASALRILALLAGVVAASLAFLAAAGALGIQQGLALAVALPLVFLAAALALSGRRATQVLLFATWLAALPLLARLSPPVTFHHSFNTGVAPSGQGVTILAIDGWTPSTDGLALEPGRQGTLLLQIRPSPLRHLDLHAYLYRRWGAATFGNRLELSTDGATFRALAVDLHLTGTALRLAGPGAFRPLLLRITASNPTPDLVVVVDDVRLTTSRLHAAVLAAFTVLGLVVAWGLSRLRWTQALAADVAALTAESELLPRLARAGAFIRDSDSLLLVGGLFTLVALVETLLHLGVDSLMTYGNMNPYRTLPDYVIDIEGFLVNRDSLDQADLSVFLASGRPGSLLMVSRVFYSYLVAVLYPWLGAYRAAVLVNVLLWGLGSLAVWKLALLLRVGRGPALLAGLLTATSVGFMAMAGQILSYQAAYCAIAVTTYLALRAVAGNRRRLREALLAGLAAGAGFLTYELVNLVAFVALLLLWHRRGRQLIAFLTLASAPAVLLQLVNRVVGLDVFHYTLFGDILRDLGAGVRDGVGAQISRYLASLTVGTLEAFVFVAPIVALLGWCTDRDRSRQLFLGLFIVVLAVPVALGPNPWPRNYFHVFPAVYVLAAAGLFRIGDLAARFAPGLGRVRESTIAVGGALIVLSSHLTVARFYYYG